MFMWESWGSKRAYHVMH